MRYRNLVTGAVIEVDSVIKGKNWEPLGSKVTTPAPVVPVPETKEEPVEIAEEVKPVKKTRKTTKTSKK